MKKLGILMMPLMAISLLASCGSKPIDLSKIDLYKKEIIYDETGKNIVSTTEYEYKNDLCVKEVGTEVNNPNYKQITEYSYDEHENAIGNYNATYENEEIVDQSWMCFDYTYDKQNRVTKEITKNSYDNIEWEVLESFEFEYKDNATIKTHYHGDGSLDYTTTYTFDKKGNLISEKMVFASDMENAIPCDWEDIYTLDKNGCATKIEHYIYPFDEKILIEVRELTYLNKLWYRPLKETTTYYESGEPYSYITTISEYDKKNRITLSKSYRGIEEGESPYYYSYSTYEY